MQPNTLSVPAAGGIGLHALEWSQQGVPLVFVHGFGNDAHVWDEVAPSVAPYYRTLALTLRGHGDSDRGPEPGRDMDLLVSDLEAALAFLGVERTVLVGHSLGGRIVMRFTGRHPKRVAGLVVVDSGPEMDARGTTRIREETRAQAARPDPSFASVDDYLRVLEQQYPAARTSTLERLAGHWTRRREDGRYELKLDLRAPRAGRTVGAEGAADVRSSLRERARQETEAFWQNLRDTSCPALVIRGAASDVLSAEVADRMVDETLPNGRLVVIPKAGHSVMLDNPEAFTRALCDFVLG